MWHVTYVLPLQNADWDANPAEFIIGHTYHNKVKVQTLCMPTQACFVA